VNTLAGDVRSSIRTIRRAPGFSAVVIATLALGIGANTAIFSIINTVLLTPSPAPDPDRVVVLATTFPEGPSYITSDQKFNVWRRQTDVLQDVSGRRSGVVNLTEVDRPEQVQAAWVTDEYFRLYGIPIAMGRGFAAGETIPNGPPVAVLSSGLWLRAFGADPDIVGKRVSISDAPFEVVGVAAPGVRTLTGEQIDVWLPLTIDPASSSQVHYFMVEARLRPGVSLAAANAKLALAADEFHRNFPNALAMGPQSTFSAQITRDALVANVRPSLWVLLGAVALVLLIACVNVANLQVARMLGRRREFAVRAALGASRARVMRQAIAEALPLAMAGGALGLLLGTAGIRALLAMNPGNIPRIGEAGSAVTLDVRVMAVTTFLSIAAGLAASLGPAMMATRLDLNGFLKDGPAGSSPRYTKTRSLLIVSELAIAVTLVVGATLLIRSFAALRSVDPGVDTRDVLTVRMSLSGPRFATTTALDRLVRASIARIEAVPGVASAAYANAVPLEGGVVLPYIVEGRPLETTLRAFHGFGSWTSVSPHYFDAFRIPLVRGRVFTDADGHDAPGVVVINEAMAARDWPNADPLHARIVIGRSAGPDLEEPAREIVGVVRNVHDGPLDRPPQPAMYVPAAQVTDGLNARIVRGSIAWIVRTHGPSPSLVPAIQQELAQTSAGVPVARIRTMNEVVTRTTLRSEFNMSLLTAFALSALLLASIGVYGLMAYTVQQRQPEIAIRMALGASGGSMRNMILRDGVVLTCAGIAIGLVLSWALARLLTAMLFGVSAHDPLAFAAAAAVLAAVAVVATLLPALAATRVDPLKALR
jgi:predicted permease